MYQCTRRRDHALPAERAADPEAAARRAATGSAADPHSITDGEVPFLVAAALDDCAPCVAQARSGSVRGRDASGVAVLVTAWLSEAVARAEASGVSLPETAAGVVRDARVTRPTRLLAGLVPLAGPERPGGSARVTQSDVRRALELFADSDRPMMFDDALHQLATLHRTPRP